MSSVVKFSKVEVKDTYLIDAVADFATETELLELMNQNPTESGVLTSKQASIEAEKIRKITLERAKEESKSQAEEIIRSAQEEASKVQAQAREEAEIELEKSRQEGYAQGRQQAIDEVNAQFDFQIGEVKRLVSEFEAYKADFAKKHNEEMKQVIVQIVEKIVNEKIETDDKMFFSIYQKAVEELSRQDWIKVLVAEKDFELATSNKDLLMSMLKGSPAFTIEVLRDAPNGTCIIETNTGVADASVNVQLERTKETILHADLME